MGERRPRGSLVNQLRHHARDRSNLYVELTWAAANHIEELEHQVEDLERSGFTRVFLHAEALIEYALHVDASWEARLPDQTSHLDGLVAQLRRSIRAVRDD